jgi:hypothetical protein
MIAMHGRVLVVLALAAACSRAPTEGPRPPPSGPTTPVARPSETPPFLLAARKDSGLVVTGVDDALVAATTSACASTTARFGAVATPFRVRVVALASVDELAAETGRSRYEVAAFAGETLYVVPSVVAARGAPLARVLQHECGHAWLRAQGIAPLPFVLEEAFAQLAADESGVHPPPPTVYDSLSALEAALARPSSAEALARAHATIAAEIVPRLRIDATALRAYLRRAAAASDPFAVALPDGKPLHVTEASRAGP